MKQKNIITIVCAIIIAFSWFIIGARFGEMQTRIAAITNAPIEEEFSEDVDWDAFGVDYADEELPLPTEKDILGIELQLAQEWPKLSEKRKRRN